MIALLLERFCEYILFFLQTFVNVFYQKMPISETIQNITMQSIQQREVKIVQIAELF